MQGSISLRIMRGFVVCIALFQSGIVCAAANQVPGKIDGGFSVDSAGNARYHISLDLPPGINGLVPDFSLNYSSAGGNGLIGMGWSLSGFSSITRCQKTRATNGAIHGVDYSSHDRLCLDGQPLLAVSGGYWASGTEYRTEKETFSRITQHGTGTSAWFEVETKGGRNLFYGSASGTKLASSAHNGATREWLLSKVQDRTASTPSASQITFDYRISDGAWRVYQATYAGGEAVVRFHYQSTRPDVLARYFAGDRISESHRLASITVHGNGAQLRRYELDYTQDPTTRRSLLKKVTEIGSDGSSQFKPIKFDYSSGEKGWVDITDQSDPPPGYWRHQIDWDGDGILDLLIVPASAMKDVQNKANIKWTPTPGAHWRLYRGLPDHKFGPALDLDANNDIYDGKTVQATDFDGDGCDDLLVKSEASDHWHVLHSSCGFSSAALTATHLQVSEKPTLLDLNGDGRQDVVGQDGTQVFYSINTGQQFAAEQHHVFTTVNDGKFDGTVFRAAAGELTGDAGDDIVVGGQQQEVTSDSSTQDGATVIDPGDPPPGGGGGDAGPTDATIFTWHDGALHRVVVAGGNAFLKYGVSADLNGDGLVDRVYPSDNWMTIINKGDGHWETPIDTGLPVDARYKPPKPVAVDYNGDGKMDILAPGPSTNPDRCAPEYQDNWPDCVGDWTLYISNGNTLVAAPSGAPGLALLGQAIMGISAGDKFHNGLQDLFLGTTKFGKHRGNRAGILESITDSAGDVTTIAYTSMLDDDVSQPSHDANKLGVINWRGDRQVVEHYTAPTGVGGTYTATYRYQGGKRNILGRGFLGFEKRIVTDSRSGSVTYRFAQNWPATGMLKRKILRKNGGTVQKPTGQIISETINTLDKKNYDTRPYPYIRTQIKNIYDLNSGQLVKSTAVTQSELNQFGDPGRTVSQVAASDLSQSSVSAPFAQTTVKSYTHASERNQYWCAAYPESTTVTHTAEGSSKSTNHSNTVDYTHCRVTGEQSAASYGTQNLGLATAYQYDGFGNVISQSITDQGTGETRTTETTYSADGRFPIAVTKAARTPAEQTSHMRWDSATGLKQSETDPNGLRTAWTYDAFGRKSSVTAPNGAETTIDREWCADASCYGSGVYRVYTSTSNGALTNGSQFTVYDGFGRKVRTGHQILGGAWSLVDTTYDNQGRVKSTTLPHKPGESVGQSISTYDDLDRQIDVKRPDGYHVTTDYSGLVTTVTDAGLHKKVTAKDLMGRVVSVTEAQGTAEQSTLEYHYDPLGNLDWVEEPGENGNRVKVQMTYDARGNKREMTDPDMGHWTYAYDAFGELTQQTDAKGQVTHLAYDAAGRLKTRTTSQGTTTWTYGTQAPAIGLLTDVSQGWDGYAKHIDYTALSQPRVITETIDGVDYRTTKHYDGFGRVSQVIYPDSLAPDQNKAPTAVIDAGPMSANPVSVGTAIELDGRGSSDPDGWPQPLTYLWSQTGGPDVTLSGVTSPTVNFSVPAAGHYRFRLSVSDGDRSDTETVEIDVAPDAPTQVTVGPNPTTTGGFTLQWAAPAKGMTATGHYEVQASDGIASPDGITPLYSGSDRQAALTKAENGSWTYGVRACDGDVCSPFSTVGESVVLPPATPAAPTLTPSVSHDGGYSVAWTAPAGALTRYVLKETHDASSQEKDVSGAVQSSPDQQSANGQWAYRVKACNGKACSGYSSEATEYVVLKPDRPGSISVPDTDSNHDGQYTVHWQAGTGDINQYQLQEAPVSSFSTLNRTWTLGNVLSHEPTVADDGDYYYRVRACYKDSEDHRSCSAWRTGGNATQVVIRPGVPGSISVPGSDSNHDGSYSVSWGPASGHVTSYQLYQADNASFSGESRVYAGTGTDKVLSNTDGSYYYRVRACNSGVCSSWRTGSDATDVVVRPAVPDMIDVPSADHDGSYAVTWSNVSQPVTAYQLYEAGNASFSGESRVYNGLLISKALSHSDGTYYYRVRACNQGVCSAWRSGTNAVAEVKRPAVPSTLNNPSTNHDGSYAVSWSSVPSPVTAYQLYEADNASFSGASRIYNGGGTDKTVNHSDGSYYYRVRACNSDICSGWRTGGNSTDVTVRPDVPSAISVPSSDSNHDGSYSVSWGTASGHVTAYQLYQADNASFSGESRVYSGLGTSKSLTRNDGSYYYRVRACNSGVCSGWRTASHSTDVVVRPGIPASIHAPDDGDHDGRITVSWGSASGAVTDYRLYESGNSDFSGESRVYHGAGTSTTLTRPDGTYYYRVRACNHGICSGWRKKSTGTQVLVAPSAPSSISRSTALSQDGSYSISWGAASGTVTHYQLFESRDGRFDDAVKVYDGTGRSTGLSKTQTSSIQGFSYRARACNHSACGSYSAGVTVSVDASSSSGGGCLKDPMSCVGVTDGASQKRAQPAGHIVRTTASNRAAFHAMHVPRPADLAAKVANASDTHHPRPHAVRTAYSGDSSHYRVIVDYAYDASGHLAGVKNHRTGKIYWHATQADAWDHQKQVQLGNGLTVNKRFNPDTGRLNSIRTGMGGGAGVQNLSYTWDDDGNLKSRTDNRTTHSEVFSYDAQHRLTGSTLDGQNNLTLTYDDAGNIASKTTASGTITYDYSGSAGLHAVSSVSGAESHSYTYDANGNIDSRDGATVDWTPDNYPDRIAGNGTVSYFSYGPDHQRYREQIEDGAGHVKELRISVGTLFEVIQKADGTVKYQHHIKAAGVDIALETRQADQPKQTRYLLHDHLGGINAIADENGNVVARMSFGAYGKRRNADTWAGDLTDTEKQALHDQYNRGYTGHEMLDKLDLIHMNGRVYDQGIGRFMSPDPNIQAPGHSENYNRYAYVMNNPLTLNDPSGFMFAMPNFGFNPKPIGHGYDDSPSGPCNTKTECAELAKYNLDKIKSEVSLSKDDNGHPDDGGMPEKPEGMKFAPVTPEGLLQNYPGTEDAKHKSEAEENEDDFTPKPLPGGVGAAMNNINEDLKFFHKGRWRDPNRDMTLGSVVKGENGKYSHTRPDHRTAGGLVGGPGFAGSGKEIKAVDNATALVVGLPLDVRPNQIKGLAEDYNALSTRVGLPVILFTTGRSYLIQGSVYQFDGSGEGERLR